MPHPAEQERRRTDYRRYLAAFELAWQRFQQEPTLHNQAVLLAGERVLYRELEKPGPFELGRSVMTPGAMAALRVAGHIPPEFLLRHRNSEWDELDEDKRTIGMPTTRHLCTAAGCSRPTVHTSMRSSGASRSGTDP